MAAKDVQFGNEVRQKMVSGVNTLANAVRWMSKSATKLFSANTAAKP